MSKRIYLTGPIDIETYQEISEALNEARDEGSNVDLIISSEGGNSYDALAIYDCITMSQDVIQIDTVATGYVASAAVLILAAGKRRYSTPNAWFMSHEDSTEVTEAYKVSEAENEIRHTRAREDQWNGLLASRTKLSAEEWTALHKRGDVYFSPAQAIEMGLIDEVLS